ADATQRWATDLSMVFVGRDAADREVAAADPRLVRYRIETALAALAPLLLREALLLAPPAVRPALEAGPLPVAVRAIVRTAAASLPVEASNSARLAHVVSEASVTALVEQLVALAATLGAPSTPFDGLGRELAAFVEALSPAEGVH
ncbi:MAG: hypothetical protein ACRENE_17375, partial [Polyangiaceae bacterium]